MQQLDRATKEYFMLDFGGSRFTHYPSGDTCLRHQWMVGRPDGAKWTEALKEFFARHPDVSVIVNSRFEIIDNANSFPHRGGDFNVGDVILVRVKEGDDDWGVCAKTITARSNFQGSDIVDPYHTFELDDGNAFYWDDHSNGWFTFRQGETDNQRVRLPVPGENVQTLDEKKANSTKWKP